MNLLTTLTARITGDDGWQTEGTVASLAAANYRLLSSSLGPTSSTPAILLWPLDAENGGKAEFSSEKRLRGWVLIGFVREI